MKEKQGTAGLLLILLGVLIFIFFMSAKPALQSGQLSGYIDQWLCSLLQPDYDTLPQEVQAVRAAQLDMWVRKTAHVLEYTVLGLVLWLVLRRFVRRPSLVCGLTLLAGVCQAGLDEVHQLFVPGRAGRPLDVCLDSMGVLLGMGAAMALQALQNRRHKRSKKRKQE